MFAERFRREAQLMNFIRTATFKPLLWLPAQHSAETLALLHGEQNRLDAWKVHLLDFDRLKTPNFLSMFSMCQSVLVKDEF